MEVLDRPLYARGGQATDHPPFYVFFGLRSYYLWDQKMARRWEVEYQIFHLHLFRLKFIRKPM